MSNNNINKDKNKDVINLIETIKLQNECIKTLTAYYLFKFELTPRQRQTLEHQAARKTRKNDHEPEVNHKKNKKNEKQHVTINNENNSSTKLNYKVNRTPIITNKDKLINNSNNNSNSIIKDGDSSITTICKLAQEYIQNDCTYNQMLDNIVKLNIFSVNTSTIKLYLDIVLKTLRSVGVITYTNINSKITDIDSTLYTAVAIFHSNINFLSKKPEYACTICQERDNYISKSKSKSKSSRKKTNTVNKDKNDEDEDDKDEGFDNIPNFSTQLEQSEEYINNLSKEILKIFFIKRTPMTSKEISDELVGLSRISNVRHVINILFTLGLLAKHGTFQFKWNGVPSYEDLVDSDCYQDFNLEE